MQSSGPARGSGRGVCSTPGLSSAKGANSAPECLLFPRVVLYPGVRLGARVTLHAGVVVGSDGFGYVFDGQVQVKFPQIGAVTIEDDVEIGSNTTIDRGSLGTTRIGREPRSTTWCRSRTTSRSAAGSSSPPRRASRGAPSSEDFAVIGGQVGFGDHARVESGAVIGSKAGVLPGKIVRGGEVYWGVPVRPLREYKRLNALFGRLPEIKQQLDDLKETVGRLEEALRSKQG